MNQVVSENETKELRSRLWGYVRVPALDMRAAPSLDPHGKAVSLLASFKYLTRDSKGDEIK